MRGVRPSFCGGVLLHAALVSGRRVVALASARRLPWAGARLPGSWRHSACTAPAVEARAIVAAGDPASFSCCEPPHHMVALTHGRPSPRLARQGRGATVPLQRTRRHLRCPSAARHAHRCVQLQLGEIIWAASAADATVKSVPG